MMATNVWYLLIGSIVTFCYGAHALNCYVGQVSTSSPNKVTSLPVSYQTCLEGSDICLTLTYNVVVGPFGKPYMQGVCGVSSAGCSVFCTMVEQRVGIVMQNCKCFDTQEVNSKLQPYVSALTTTPPAVLLQCYVGQASTTPPYERSYVNRQTCAKDEDACITLQYKVTKGSNELSFTQSVCGVAQVVCPIFCKTIESHLPGDARLKGCKCYNTKDENDKMARFMGYYNGSRAASQEDT